MNLYRQIMLLRYYKYDLKTARRKVKIERVLYFTLANVANFLYSRTKDPSFYALFWYFLIEQCNSFRSLEVYSNEYCELKNMYQEVIKRYNQDVNKTLELTNPVQIAQMYMNAYKEGFLSKNGIYEYSSDTKELIENDTILGASIFTGKACCRHSSDLLADIFDDYGFESVRIPTGYNTASPAIRMDEISDTAFDKVLSLAYSALEGKNIDDELMTLGNITINKKWEYNRDRVPRNHSITGVSYNGEAYYIDPTNDSYYRLDNETGRLVNSWGNVENTIKNKIHEMFKDRKKLEKIMELDSANFDSIYSLKHDTNLLYWKNFDIFDKFYRENHEAYEEITEKLKKINM